MTLRSLLCAAALLLAAWLAVPALGEGRPATECDGTAKPDTDQAAGCFARNPLFGPLRLPKPPSPIGKLTVHYKRFGRLGQANFVQKFRSDSGWRYPPNDGFDGPAAPRELDNGELIDRFGSPRGSFLSPAGTAYARRSIPPASLNSYPNDVAYNYHVYRVTSPFQVEAGSTAPWFAQPGGSTQFKTCFGAIPCDGPNQVNVAYLLAHGDLVEVRRTAILRRN